MSTETESEVPKPTPSMENNGPRDIDSNYNMDDWDSELENHDDDDDDLESEDSGDPDQMPMTPSAEKSQIPCRLASSLDGYSPIPPNSGLMRRCHRRGCRFSHDQPNEEEIGRCNICFEDKVKRYGLLSGCSHVFCISTISHPSPDLF